MARNYQPATSRFWRKSWARRGFRHRKNSEVLAVFSLFLAVFAHKFQVAQIKNIARSGFGAALVVL
jgi:hypothetical protein